MFLRGRHNITCTTLQSTQHRMAFRDFLLFNTKIFTSNACTQIIPYFRVTINISLHHSLHHELILWSSHQLNMIKTTTSYIKTFKKKLHSVYCKSWCFTWRLQTYIILRAGAADRSLSSFRPLRYFGQTANVWHNGFCGIRNGSGTRYLKDCIIRNVSFTKRWQFNYRYFYMTGFCSSS